MKPKNIGMEKATAYDVEPRTGKPFSSIKISTKMSMGMPRKNVDDAMMKLNAQVPYTEPRKEFGATDWEIFAEQNTEPNYNPMEYKNTTNLNGDTKGKRYQGQKPERI